MRVLFTNRFRDERNIIAELALRREVAVIVLCGGLGLETTDTTVAAWARAQEPIKTLVVPGPEDRDMLMPENISNGLLRISNFEFSGLDCIPDDGRLNKFRCRRDDDYFNFPEQHVGVDPVWPETARGLYTISTRLALLPTPQAFISSVYVLPPPYGVSFSSEKIGDPCPHCKRPFEPYVPINGSRAVRRFIEDHQPRMVIHQYEGAEWSEKMVGRTKCVLLGKTVVYDLLTRERV